MRIRLETEEDVQRIVREMRAAWSRAPWGRGGRPRWDILEGTLREDLAKGDTDLTGDPDLLEYITNALDPQAQKQRAKATAVRRKQEAEDEAWEAQGVDLYGPMEEGPLAMERAGRGQKVWLYHGTTSKFLPSIRKHGLIVGEGENKIDPQETPGVYLTVVAAGSGASAQFYARRAAAHFGGNPVILRVLVDFDDLEWDQDDADLASGRYQFVTDYVPASAIMEIDGKRQGRRPNPEDTMPTKEAREFISQEISHLMRDKGYDQQRAIAAAHAIARRKGFRSVPENPNRAHNPIQGEEYEPGKFPKWVKEGVEVVVKSTPFLRQHGIRVGYSGMDTHVWPGEIGVVTREEWVSGGPYAHVEGQQMWRYVIRFPRYRDLPVETADWDQLKRVPKPRAANPMGSLHHPAGTLLAVALGAVVIAGAWAIFRSKPADAGQVATQRAWVDTRVLPQGATIELLGDEEGRKLGVQLGFALPNVPINIHTPDAQLVVPNGRPTLFLLAMSDDPTEYLNDIITAFRGEPPGPIVWVPSNASLDVQATMSSVFQAGRQAAHEIVGIAPSDATGTSGWGASVASDLLNPNGVPTSRRI